MVTWEDVRKTALELPSVEESTSYGTPAFKVKGKMFVRLRPEGDVLVVRVDWVDRDYLMETRPDLYYITPHYKDYPAILVRMAALDPAGCRHGAA